MGSYIERLNDVLHTEPEQDRTRVQPAPKLQGRITLDGVTFRYSPLLPPAVSDVSLEIANPIQLQPLAIEFPRLVMVIAHLGHPWINETLVLIRKHRNLYADISALYYRPWQFYNALVAAMEYGVLHRLLLGSDYPFTTPQQTLDALRVVNRMAENTNLPRIPETAIEQMIHRDTLSLLGIG